MMQGKPKEEIFFYDKDHPAEMLKTFAISEDEHRTIIIVYAGIQDKRVINFQIEGKNSTANVVIIPLLWKSQSLDLTINQYHVASQSTSNVQIVGAVGGTAQLRATVVSRCKHEVQNVSAVQQSNILLLSPHARVIAMPSIQSINMNVYCKHGTSLRTFDGDQLAYIKLRGIDELKAHALLCESFLLSWMNNEMGERNQEVLTTYIRGIIDQLIERL